MFSLYLWSNYIWSPYVWANGRSVVIVATGPAVDFTMPPVSSYVQTWEKYEDEVFVAYFDFFLYPQVERLGQGLGTPTFTGGGLPIGAATLTLGISGTMTKVGCPLGGGTSGNVYTIEFGVETDEGQVLIHRGLVSVI